MKKEYIKQPRFNTKSIISIWVWFNVNFLYAVLSIDEIVFWDYENNLFQFWTIFNGILLGYITTVERPKASKGFIGIANSFIELGRKVKDAFRQVDDEVGLFRDKTTINSFPVKPSPEPHVEDLVMYGVDEKSVDEKDDDVDSDVDRNVDGNEELKLDECKRCNDKIEPLE